MGTKLIQYWQSFKAACLDTAFPPKCVICGQKTSVAHSACPNCWGKIDFITAPMCKKCGIPLAYEGDYHRRCPEAKHYYSSSVSAIKYNEQAANLIQKFKFADRVDLAKVMATWMVQAGNHLLAKADILTPAPMHVAKLKDRGYNQAALLTKQVAKISTKPYILDLLEKTKATPAQSSLSQKERRKNLKGVFRLNPKYRNILKGKTIVIIDDISTTGSTAHECSKILAREGAKNIFVLTCAKTCGREKWK
jgi:ComF family protein